MNNPLPVVICLMGPTASGKTDLAVRLSERLPCDIISVDSALVYRDMNIGTAKPEPELLERAPHRLIDLLDPSESYSAADFCRDATREIEIVLRAGRIPLLVGGTMLYFKALQEGLASLPSADESIRKQLAEEAEEFGWPYLHTRLQAIDPESAARIHPNDPQRISRALEVYAVSGKTLTELWQVQASGKFAESGYTTKEGKESGTNMPYTMLNLAVAPMDRKLLHERIRIRFESMLQQGLVGEVESLYRRGDLNPGMPSMRCVGYRQVWDYLDGKMSYTEMSERGVIATRQLAKRQLTWLRGWPDLHWLESTSDNLLDQALKIINTASISGNRLP
ncbi:MAG: tRNA (adenosine(37)-N6)-dimethylallyltransferase MiaA [Hahellaceae bacterium]|nr:tRNA (adenosine(37)-N6)-dimethylallyltransferase MiaA [Hahellaceae bacterium]MCP5170003.1 tRNA (adenosine(37)-N6)-dimethylallyltransferase MiaA [Hahellaceae bacterium]